MTEEQKRFLAGELIGEPVSVIYSSCKDWIGLEGNIVDETLHTFVLDTSRGRKRMGKATCTWLFRNAGVAVDGAHLVMRPFERTKRLRA